MIIRDYETLEQEMKQIHIREAVWVDVPTLLEFEQKLIDAERPFETKFVDEHFVYNDFDELINNPNSVVLVAELNNKLVGSGFARIEPSKPYLIHQQHAYLGFIYVDPCARGKNISSVLIESLMQWSKAQGVSEISLKVYAENAPAIRVYEKIGFAKHHFLMRMSLK